MADAVSSKIKSKFPGVVWKESFSTTGRFDVVDIVESDDPKQVMKVAMIIRAYGHSTTETLGAVLRWYTSINSVISWVLIIIGAIIMIVGYLLKSRTP